MAKAELTQAKHTRQSVSDLILEHWESDLPDKVIETLRPFNGKAITTRLLDKLPGGKEAWRLERHYGWTSLQTRGYGCNWIKEDVSIDLMLARSEASVPLDLAWVEENNGAYFAARRERNHKRMEARNTAKVLDDIAEAMNAAERAIVALKTAEARIEELAAYGTVLDPDRYSIQRACGLSDVDGRPILARDFKESK